MPTFVTPDEIRTFLDVDEAALPDARANLLLDLVEGAVLDACGRTSLGEANVDVRLDGRGTPVVTLPWHPVTAVASVVEDPDGEATALEEGVDFEWSAAGVLTRLNGIWLKRARWYAVTFSHDFGDTVPAGFRAVVFRVAARAVDNPTGLKGQAPEGMAVTFGDEARVTDGDRRDLLPYSVLVP